MLNAMNPIVAVHNAARHYCMERSTHWHREYAQLAAVGRDRTTSDTGKWNYTDDSYAVFPRYQVLAAILVEVERFVPAEFASVGEARALMVLAGETAESPFTRYKNPIAVEAVRDERLRFVEFIRSADEQRLADLPLLSFRRALGVAEHRQLHEAFRRRWGSWYGGFVNPPNLPTDAVTLHAAAMEAPDACANLCRLLQDRGVKRLLELRESGEGRGV
jgi:hypothetical protein